MTDPIRPRLQARLARLRERMPRLQQLRGWLSHLAATLTSRPEGLGRRQSEPLKAAQPEPGEPQAGLDRPGALRLGGRWLRPAWRLSLPGGIRPWITFASLGFVLAALISHSRQLLQLDLDPQGWLWLLLGVGLSLLSVVANGVAWSVLLRWLGHKPLAAQPVAHFMVTNLRKFLPGGIWHLAARLQDLRRGSAGLAAPLPGPAALLAVVLEPLLAACAALALAAAGGWQGGLGLLGLLPLGLLLPRWLAPLLERLERRKARELQARIAADGALQGLEAIDEAEPAAGAALSLPGYPWRPLLGEMVFVLLRFAGFACCVWAFDLQLALSWPTWLAGFAQAWTVGLVVPGAPGGLGVFEAVLLLRLGGLLPAAPLLAVALSYRLVATTADLLGAGLADLDSRESTGAPQNPGGTSQ